MSTKKIREGLEETEKQMAYLQERMSKAESGLKAAEKKLADAEFEAAASKWAVRGLMAENLKCTISTYAGMTPDPDFIRHVGDQAAHQFIRQAKLAFRDHAEMNMLRAKQGPRAHPYLKPEDGVIPRSYWSE